MSDLCLVCTTPIWWVECPTGGWWKHDVHPSDDHDAEGGCSPATCDFDSDESEK